jgi:REP element-mobilizing transposase RayT
MHQSSPRTALVSPIGAGVGNAIEELKRLVGLCIAREAEWVACFRNSARFKTRSGMHTSGCIRALIFSMRFGRVLSVKIAGGNRGAEQLVLPFANGWGGARANAGRRRKAGRGNVAHRKREAHRRWEPVLVTLRYRLSSLRHQFVFPTVHAVIAAANRRGDGRFRITHFSVQENHVHLLVEAESRRDLLSGMRGFSVSLARQINRLLMRTGPLLDDRWHARALKTPRMVRHALLYVLANGRKHGVTTRLVDPLSSAPYFAGFRQCGGRAPCVGAPQLLPPSVRSRPPPVVAPGTWLLRSGWRRGGLLSLHDNPKLSR